MPSWNWFKSPYKKVRNGGYTVNLSSRRLDDTDAKEIARALEDPNTNVKELDLSHNRIGDEGGKAIAKALESNSTLTRLYLNVNSIEVEGGKAIEELMRPANREKRALEVAQRKLLEKPHNVYRPEPENTVLVERRKPSFFSTLLSKKLSHADVTVPEFLDKLVPLISNVHEMKLFYTFLRAALSQGILSTERISVPLEQALQRTAETCDNEDALATFKMILNKCAADQLLHEHTFHVMDNRAEVKRMSNATFILDMKTAIEQNARDIGHLDGTVEALKQNIRVLVSNIRAVHHSVDKLQSGMRFKMKMEATIGMVSSVVNALTLGIGGNLLQAFERIVGHVVDYGDSVHILSVIRAETNAGEAAKLESSFQEGVNTAIEVLNSAADVIAEQKMEAALERGDPLIVLGITASLNNPNQDTGMIAHHGGGELMEIYADAILSTEDESRLELHAAVKFGDKDELHELLARDGAIATVINDTDSCQRTATDLAALTGQLEVMEMLLSNGGRYSVRSKPRMKVLAKKRAANVTEYLELVHAITELDD